MKYNLDLLLTNCMLIDGNGGSPIENACIGIKDGKIALIENADSMADECQARLVIDLHNAAALPGFINTHVHAGFKYVGGVIRKDFQEEYLKACIAEGITTIRDEGMLSEGSLQEVLAKKLQLDNYGHYPRIITTGKFFTASGGYGGQQPIQITSREEAKAKVNEVLDLGIDMIKTVLEDGMDPSTFGLPKLSEEILTAICEAAHSRETRVSAHVTQAHNLKKLVDAGIDDAGHMVYDSLSDELIHQMVNKNVYVIPTLVVLKMIQDKYGAPLLAQGMKNVKRFIEAGGKIALGDDFIEAEEPWYRLGMPYMELQLLHEAGLATMQIIVAATKNAAEVCGVSAKVGTIEIGKAADMLIVNGNPLKDLDDIKKVVMVIKEGQIVQNNRV